MVALVICLIIIFIRICLAIIKTIKNSYNPRLLELIDEWNELNEEYYACKKEIEASGLIEQENLLKEQLEEWEEHYKENDFSGRILELREQHKEGYDSLEEEFGKKVDALGEEFNEKERRLDEEIGVAEIRDKAEGLQVQGVDWNEIDKLYKKIGALENKYKEKYKSLEEEENKRYSVLEHEYKEKEKEFEKRIGIEGLYDESYEVEEEGRKIKDEINSISKKVGAYYDKSGVKKRMKKRLKILGEVRELGLENNFFRVVDTEECF